MARRLPYDGVFRNARPGETIVVQELQDHRHGTLAANPSPLTGGDLADEFLRYLLAVERLAAAELDRAVEARRRSAQRIDLVLTELGLLSEDVLLTELSQFLGVTIVTAAELPDALVPTGLATSFLKRNRILPIACTDQLITVVLEDPFDRSLLMSIGYFADRRVEARLMRARELTAAIDRLRESNDDGTANGSDDVAHVDEEDIERLKEAASEAPIVRLVNRLLTSAVLENASDIHIEPRPTYVVVRFRIDGALQEIETLSPELQAGVASRIKLLAKLNIAERRMPQDGRTKVMVAGRQIDVRISFVPTQHGESIVMRLLDKERVDLTFVSLGFDGPARSALERMIAEPNGIVLVTGPTGSGKSTTLYTALKQLNSADRKVFSIEDPIEYQLAGINQTQVKPDIGLDFVHVLRSILRQDPDVVMLGEIRDVETAKTAIQASLTGHLVLSTLHTNSAAASIARLIDMGVEDYLLASSLTGVVAQRLVRKLCLECATQRSIAPNLAGRLLAEMPPGEQTVDMSQMKQPVGCAACRGTGFKGRTCIAEALVVTEEIRSLIMRRTSDREIEQAARLSGMETLLQSGLRKSFAGIASIDDVLRVARF
jgi:general secretion pathway protein E